MYCQLEFDRDAFPRGLPNISEPLGAKKFLIQETQAQLFLITQLFALEITLQTPDTALVVQQMK